MVDESAPRVFALLVGRGCRSGHSWRPISRSASLFHLLGDARSSPENSFMCASCNLCRLMMGGRLPVDVPFLPGRERPVLRNSTSMPRRSFASRSEAGPSRQPIAFSDASCLLKVVVSASLGHDLGSPREFMMATDLPCFAYPRSHGSAAGSTNVQSGDGPGPNDGPPYPRHTFLACSSCSRLNAVGRRRRRISSLVRMPARPAGLRIFPRPALGRRPNVGITSFVRRARALSKGDGP